MCASPGEISQIHLAVQYMLPGSAFGAGTPSRTPLLCWAAPSVEGAPSSSNEADSAGIQAEHISRTELQAPGFAWLLLPLIYEVLLPLTPLSALHQLLECLNLITFQLPR